MSEIDWDVFEQSKYWSPVPGIEHNIVLSDWSMSNKLYRGKPKVVLTFRVVEVDGKQMPPDTEFNTGGNNALQFKPSVIYANERGEKYINVIIRRNNNNQYEVADFNLVNREVSRMQGKYRR